MRSFTRTVATDSFSSRDRHTGSFPNSGGDRPRDVRRWDSFGRVWGSTCAPDRAAQQAVHVNSWGEGGQSCPIRASRQHEWGFIGRSGRGTGDYPRQITDFPPAFLGWGAGDVGSHLARTRTLNEGTIIQGQGPNRSQGRSKRGRSQVPAGGRRHGCFPGISCIPRSRGSDSCNAGPWPELAQFSIGTGNTLSNSQEGSCQHFRLQSPENNRSRPCPFAASAALLLTYGSYPARTRTLNEGTKIPCVTITPPGNKPRPSPTSDCRARPICSTV